MIHNAFMTQSNLSLLWRYVSLSLLCVLILCALSWIYLDIPIAEFFHQVRIFRKPSKYITILGNSGLWIFVAVLGLIYGWINKNRRSYMDKFLTMILALSTSGLIVNVMKMAIGRYRPRAWVHQAIYKIDPFMVTYSKCSFPSGHTQTIFAVMVSLSFIFPKGRWVFLSLAILVSATRIALTNHFLSDVLMGAYIGGISAFLCYTHRDIWTDKRLFSPH